jgi:hypothetical protein
MGSKAPPPPPPPPPPPAPAPPPTPVAKAPIKQATSLSQVIASSGVLSRSLKKRGGPRKVSGRQVLGAGLKLYNQ